MESGRSEEHTSDFTVTSNPQDITRFDILLKRLPFQRYLRLKWKLGASNHNLLYSYVCIHLHLALRLGYFLSRYRRVPSLICNRFNSCNLRDELHQKSTGTVTKPMMVQRWTKAPRCSGSVVCGTPELHD